MRVRGELVCARCRRPPLPPTWERRSRGELVQTTGSPDAVGPGCTCGIAALVDEDGRSLALRPRTEWPHPGSAWRAAAQRWVVGGFVAGLFGLFAPDRTVTAIVGLAVLVEALRRSFRVVQVARARPQRDRQARQLLEAGRERAGPVRDIATCDDGWCRIQGRVEVLDPAREDHPDLGLFLARDRLTAQSPIFEERSCGRIAIIDATGIAVVDDDWFRVLPVAGTLPLEGELAARAGDVIEVVGRARRARAPDLRHLVAGDGYRAGEPVVLAFEGSADAPICVLAPRYVHDRG